MTVSGVEPQDAKLEGATESATFTVLAWATSMTFVVLGSHVKESMVLPWPAAEANVMVTGSVPQPAFGAALWIGPTDTYAPTMMTVIARPAIIYGRFRMVNDCTFQTALSPS